MQIGPTKIFQKIVGLIKTLAVEMKSSLVGCRRILGRIRRMPRPQKAKTHIVVSKDKESICQLYYTGLQEKYRGRKGKQRKKIFHPK